MRFRLACVEGIQPEEDTDAQRMGTHWHALHEVYADNYAAAREDGCPEPHEAALHQVIQHLNERYADVPNFKTPEEWEIERQILATSFIGYLWYWQDDPYEVLMSEIEFKQAMMHPRVGLPLPTSEVVRAGRIDHIIRYHGVVGNLERKSTGQSIAPDSDYWRRWSKDIQISMYALAFRTMREQGLENFGIELQEGDRFGNTIVDIWHKPTIKPAKLTQADTKKFIENGEYCGQEFIVSTKDEIVCVDDWRAEVIPGKKGFALRETPGMYAARLLADIQERPEFYFARREIPRTDDEIDRFVNTVYNLYQFGRLIEKSGCWYENESSCRDPYPCEFIPICYGAGSEAACNGGELPPGFKRTTPVTVGGRELHEPE
jgi:hypothetical protein